MLMGMLLLVPARHAMAQDLEPLFTAASSDAAAVVPLIEAASAAIASLPTTPALALAERLSPFSQRLYLSDEQLPGMEALGVELVPRTQGSTHWGLARQYGIGMESLEWLDPNPGARRVKIIDAKTHPFCLAIARGACRVAIWHGASLVAVFRIAVGTPDHPPPLGETSIASRVRDPEWRDPQTGTVYGPHDPGNFLGGYWLGFAPGADGSFHGIGMHGWTAQDQGQWLERRSSHGCIRMAQEDLKRVYGLVRPGAQVIIRD